MAIAITSAMPRPISDTLRRRFWAVAVAATIVWESSHSTVAMPELGISNFDKVAHFFVYGLLATLTVRLGRGARAAWLAWLAVSFFGVTDEWHQSFVPGRSCEFGDWVADTSGAALASALYTCWGWYRTRLEGSVLPKPRVEIPPSPASVSAP